MRKKGADGSGAPIANSSVQWGDPALVYGVRIRSRFDEVRDHLPLGLAAPFAYAGPSVCGVVEWLRTPSVASTNPCTVCDEHLGEVPAKRGGRNVQRRVSRVHVVANRGEEIRLGVLAARSGSDRTRCETWRGLKATRRLEAIFRSDRTEEGEQRPVVGAVELVTGCGH
jgi:hypothetical protein